MPLTSHSLVSRSLFSRPLGAGSEGRAGRGVQCGGWAGQLLQAYPSPTPPQDRFAYSHLLHRDFSISMTAFSLLDCHSLQLQPFLWHYSYHLDQAGIYQKPLCYHRVFPRPPLLVLCLCSATFHMLLRHRYKGGLFLLDETHLPWGSNSAIHRGDEYPGIGAYGLFGYRYAFWERGCSMELVNPLEG